MSLHAAPPYLCISTSAHHPIPAGDGDAAGMTEQVVVCSAYKGVGISRHGAIQIMEDRHFVTVIIIVSKPLARSAKKHFQSNLAGDSKEANRKGLNLQCFNSQESDTSKTR